MRSPVALRILGVLTLFGLGAFEGAAAAALDAENATSTDVSEPVAHQFFEAFGLSMNLCASLAEERALALGLQPGRGPANSPRGAKYFVNPAVPRAQIYFRQEENEGDLELADLNMFLSNTLSREEVMVEAGRMEALYGPGACRERPVNVVCQGTRDVGPYQISLRAQYDAQWIRYTFRNRFKLSQFFEPSPVCIGSAAPAPDPPDPPTQPGTPPGPNSSTETDDPRPETAGPPGVPSQPPQRESQPGGEGSQPPSTGDPPPSQGLPGQKLFEAAQALEEQASAQGSRELHLRAAELYEQAAALGHAQAMFNLSRKHARGEGVERSPETELELLKRAAQAGLPQAQYNLALNYASGSGVGENQETATELLEAAAEAGDMEAQLALAKRKLAGPENEQGDQEAIDLLEEAAAGGSAEAQYLLGRIFEDGILAPRDARRSEEYFCTAAATGYKPAVEKCGRSFLPPNDTAKLGPQIRY
jgi:TPR repeat protein